MDGGPAKPKGPGGRPERISQAVVDRIYEALRVGASPRLAAEYAGINQDTINRWLRKGSKSRRRGRTDCPYRAFSDGFGAAAALAEVAHLANIAAAAKGSPRRPVERDKKGRVVHPAEPSRAGDWRASRWWLARHRPDEYAERHYRIEDTGPPPPQLPAASGLSSSPAGIVVYLPAEEPLDGEPEPERVEVDAVVVETAPSGPRSNGHGSP